MDGLDAIGPLLFPVWTFYAIPWVIGGFAAVVAGVLARSWRKGLGIGIMTVPVWDTVWGILESFGPLLQGGLVLRPYTRHQLSGLYSYKFLADLGYLGLGFLVYASHGRPFWALSPSLVAQRLAAVGLPLGKRSLGIRGEGTSAFAGLLLFPLLLGSTWAVNWWLSGFSSLTQSDESSLFANMTPYHALTISLAAGFGEELVYRGLVQTGLARGFRAFAGPNPGAMARGLAIGAAILVQAPFFGFAHSGYGTWIHVLLPTLFALFAGVVAYLFGLWAAISLHVLVDVVAFGIEASPNAAWVLPALEWFLLANVVLSLAWGIALLVRGLVRRAGAGPA